LKQSKSNHENTKNSRKHEEKAKNVQFSLLPGGFAYFRDWFLLLLPRPQGGYPLSITTTGEGLSLQVTKTPENMRKELENTPFSCFPLFFVLS